jgi:hypothetical protein
MPKKTPTPFELAQTAIALYQLRLARPGIPILNQPADYFRQAKTLLAEAQRFLKEPQSDATANLLVRSGNANIEHYFRAGKSVPFDLLLKPKREQGSQKKKSKKSRTHVGTINTLNGLEKAIRRYFSKTDAARIMRARAMTEKQWGHLIQAQKNAIQERAAKRVKGSSSKKSQLD